MIILLYGQDNYRSRQKLNEIIGHYKKINQSGLNLIYLDNKNLKFTDFKSVFEQVSMFNEKKLVVLSNSFSDKIFKENVFKNIESFIKSKNVVLFYEEFEISKNDSFLCFLKKQAKVQEFQFLEGENLKNWVKKEFSKFNAEISQDGLNKVIDFVGSDLWRFSNEIKKLANYKKDKKIEVKDIELLVKPKIETAIFKTIDAVAQKNKKKALFSIHQHLDKGENPLYLFSMINFQFRNLLIIKDFIEKGVAYDSVLKTTSLHPFVIKKSYQQADRFIFQELKKIYCRIFEVDLNIKTGKINSETALDMLIAEM